MISDKSKLKAPFFLLIVLALVLSACGSAGQTPKPSPVVSAGETSPGKATSAPANTLPPSAVPATPTPMPSPTATPEPLAIKVNDQGITMVEYQASLKQLQEAEKAEGKTLTPEQERQTVIDTLVNEELLAQEAVAQGFKMDEPALQAEVDKLAQQRGGEPALRDWYSYYGYTDAAFRSELRRSLAAAWERDKIIQTVPEQAEQIHARQILVHTQETADSTLKQVQIPGTDFAAYAFGYDPQTGGDLGWFPRGYLLQPEVEAAAFALQPGQISPVIKSNIGYHILQVIARETRPLSPDARRVLQHKTLDSWLSTAKEKSKIEILL